MIVVISVVVIVVVIIVVIPPAAALVLLSWPHSTFTRILLIMMIMWFRLPAGSVRARQSVRR
ncbi:hypothetical protein D3C72_2008430 [compost metagenome]